MNEREKWERIWEEEKEYELTSDPLKYDYVLECKEKDTVLDVGCGILYFLEFWGKRIPYLVGIDIASTALNKAKKRVEELKLKEQVDLVCATSDYLPFKKGSFDLVMVMSLLSSKAEGYLKTLKEAYRVARTNLGFNLTHIESVSHCEEVPENAKRYEFGWICEGEKKVFLSNEESVKRLLKKFKMVGTLRVWEESNLYWRGCPIGETWKNDIVVKAKKVQTRREKLLDRLRYLFHLPRW